MWPGPPEDRRASLEPLPDETQVLVGESPDIDPAEEARREADRADRAIIDEAIERFNLSDEAESTLRQEMREDKRFIAGHHWPDTIKAEREMDGRPCLTIDKIQPYINQITNQQRMSRPAIQVGPVDEFSDIETARIIQGIVRLIERDSRAELAYDHACQDQVGIGRGWWTITAEFAENESMTAGMFVQDLKIRRVRNPLRIYRDPAAQEPDYSDGLFLHDLVDLPRKEFEAMYGAEAVKGLSTFEQSGGHVPGWLSRETVRVSKYWRVVIDRQKVYLGADGKVVPESALLAQLQPGQTLDIFKDILKNSRWLERKRVEWYLMTAAQILDRGVWKAPFIPYIPVLGTELDQDGVVDLRGIVRSARDPMRRFDYMVTAEAESIGLAPKAPFIGYKGQFTDPKWKDANRRNYPYLESEMLDINGERVPLPQRNVYEPPIRAIADGIRQADSDLRVVTGYYDQHPNESVGSERSGRAILARQRQGEIGNSHFIDNLARAITYTGKQLIALIPSYYDQFRIMRIMGEDGKPEPVGVFAGASQKPPESMPLPPGLKAIRDLSVGKYDVTVKMGKSYQAAREEKQDALTALAQAAPPLVPQFADVWIGSYDWDGAQEIAQRLRPPSMEGPDGEKIPPAVAQKLTMLMQQNQQLIAELDKRQNLIENKTLELQTRERIAQMQVEAQLLIAQMQTNTTQAIGEMNHRIDMLSTALDADAQHLDRVRTAHDIAADTADRFTSSSGSGAPESTPSAPVIPFQSTPAPEPAPVGGPDLPTGA